MQISTNDIKVKPNNDSQVEYVYSMDEYIEKLLLIKQPSLDKLYGDLDKKSDILLLTKKIFNDFNISDIASVKINEQTENSYYRFYSISYDKRTYYNNCIETVLHEVAHFFCCVIFNVKYEQHGAFFTSVLKWLFKHYNLLNDNDFKSIEENTSFQKIKFVDEAIVNIETFNIEKANTLLKKLDFIKDRKINNSETFIFKDLIKKENHHLIINNKSGKAIYTIRKLFAFELETEMFNNMNENDLSNFVLYSPIYVMDSYGYQVTARNHWAGQYGFRVHFAERDCNGVRVRAVSKVIRHHDRNEVNKRLKAMTSISKKNEKKYKRCLTLSQYNLLLQSFEKSVYEVEL